MKYITRHEIKSNAETYLRYITRKYIEAREYVDLGDFDRIEDIPPFIRVNADITPKS
jgi:hypothetical protein